MNILVTSISRKVPLLKALRKAALRIDRTSKIWGGDLNPQCVGLYFVDEFWRMPKLAELTWDTLVNYCSIRDITAIIPTRDGELSFFAHFKEKLRDNGIHVMVSDKDSVELCLDKLLFFEKLEAIGYPAIPTVKDIDKLNSQQFVVKERFGAGSRSIGLCLEKEEALAQARTLQEPIFQPYVVGKEYSVDLYVDLHKQTKGAIARLRELVVNGESQITVTLHYERLELLAASLVEALGLYGHIILQVLVDDEDRFHIIECNSRFGGASTLSVQAGLDSFYWFLLESGGVDLGGYPFARSERELKQIRYAEDLILV
jgi:carbamoyl-phosphate synthase large subunit